MGKLRLSDIARAAGVSTATVSNALNHRGGVRKDLADDIRRMAAHMGYAAEGEKKRGCFRFVIYKKHGMVVMDTPFFAQLVEGVQSECQNLSCDLLINHVRQGEDLSPLMNMPLLVLATEMDETDLTPFRCLADPVLLLDSDFSHEPFSSVSIDNREAGYIAGRRLVSCGHERIGFLDSSLPFNNMRDRYAGFCEALRENGLQPAARVPLEPTMEGACRDMAAYLSQKPALPTAFFAGNDIIAIGASRALKHAGLRLPADVSMIGMDDMPMCQVVEPALSTIRVDKHALGVIAVDRLYKMTSEKPPVCQRTRMGVVMVERSSVRRL